MQNIEMTYSDQRLVKIMRFSQVMMIFDAINQMVVAREESVFGLSGMVFMFFGMAILTQFTIKLIYSRQKALGFRLFLSLILVMISIMMWLQGGLASIGAMSMPVILLLAALYGRAIENIGFCIAVILITFALGFNGLYGWYMPAVDFVSTSQQRLAEVIIIMVISAYVTWAVGNDMREAFGKLSNEHRRIDESNTAIKKLVKTDFLTGLSNIEYAQSNYVKTLATLPPKQRIFFYFIDLDGFKDINELFDLKAGDDLLVLVSKAITSVSPEGAQIARLSADEFVVFFATDNTLDPSIFAQKLLDTIAKPHELFGTLIQITASIGVASTQDSDFVTLRRRADMAMFQSKTTARNSYHIYNDLLEKEYMKDTYIVQGLKEGLEKGWLELHYQPKVALPSQNITGVEALIRWPKNNPQKYTPEQFMGVIESTELVHEVGEWVIKEACNACRKWHQQGHKITVAVNVSAQQLLNPHFAKTVQDILAASGLKASYLEIELTERFLVGNNDDVEKQLQALRKIGVILSIDDFGTGYANVSYLTDLDIDVLKIDQSFVRQLTVSEPIKHILKGIIDIANAMNLKVVAEGVETKSELAEVLALGCQIGQGYLWSRPIQFSEVVNYLNKQPAHSSCASAV